MSRPTLFALQVLVAVVCIVLWQVLSTVPVFGKILLPPFFFSNPFDVFSQIVKWFASGVIWKHLGITLAESILAFVIGSLGGVLVGFWFARQPIVAAVFDPYVKMVNALPRVVLAPIFALWLGLGIWSKVALGVTLVFFIVFFNVYQGVKEVSRTVLDNGRMLGFGVKFYGEGTPMAGQNERSFPVVIQYIDDKSSVVWPKSQAQRDAVLPLPKGTTYSNQ